MNQGASAEGVVIAPNWPHDIEERIKNYLLDNPGCQIIVIDSLGQISSPAPHETTGKRPELLIVDEVRLLPADITNEWIQQALAIRMGEDVEPVVMKKFTNNDPWRRQGKRKAPRPR